MPWIKPKVPKLVFPAEPLAISNTLSDSRETVEMNAIAPPVVALEVANAVEPLIVAIPMAATVAAPATPELSTPNEMVRPSAATKVKPSPLSDATTPV